MSLRTPNRSTVREPRVDPDADRLEVVVTCESLFAAQPLPATGDVVIGRSVDCDLRVNHPSISREHALLRIGPTLTIEDLGSANGTRLRGEPLVANAATPLHPGEVVDLGSVLLVVRPRVRATTARRVLTHDYFELRLEEECTRGGRGGASFAVLHVAATGGDPDAARDAVLAAVRPGDVVGAYAPGTYEVLLVEGDAVATERTARQVVTAAARAGLALRTGVAVFPRDGSSASALLAHAAADAAGSDGPDRAAPALATGAMTDLYRLAEAVAVGTISVLVLGETGAGKEVMAETVHRLSPRRNAPFLRLNCAALTETLLESELFGHEKGAFTGATSAKPGLLETADGGTVFLDEVGELTASTQVKLLRVLEERQVMRVGALKSRAIDVRFVAATNRDLEAEVERGAFRRDLYYRLSAATLLVPPLRERVGEIAGLARAFLDGAARALDRPPPELAADALAMLEGYAWPGNIRELRNAIERAVLLCGTGPIRPAHLPGDKMRATVAPRRTTAPEMAVPTPLPSSGPAPAADRPLRDEIRTQVEQLERQRIVDALARAAGNQSVAARLLGMPRRTLVKRLRAYGIPRPRSRNREEPA